MKYIDQDSLNLHTVTEKLNQNIIIYYISVAGTPVLKQLFRSDTINLTLILHLKFAPNTVF